MRNPNACSHGHTWEQKCPFCEVLYWREIRMFAKRNLERADANITRAMQSIKAQRKCAAVQMSDQMVCRYCDKAWDMNDPDPPLCFSVTK